MGACLSSPATPAAAKGGSAAPSSAAQAPAAAKPAPVEEKKSEANDDVTEIDASELINMQKISENSVCTLYSATWHGSAVSYRVLKQQISRDALYKELQMAASYRHPAMMLFMGFAHSSSTKRYGLVTPLMKRGSLFDVLHAPVAEVCTLDR